MSLVQEWVAVAVVAVVVVVEAAMVPTMGMTTVIVWPHSWQQQTVYPAAHFRCLRALSHLGQWMAA